MPHRFSTPAPCSMPRRCALFLLAWVWCLPVLAQGQVIQPNAVQESTVAERSKLPRYDIESLSDAQYPPIDEHFSVAQGPHGYLWMTTKYELRRFNGVETVAFPFEGEGLPFVDQLDNIAVDSLGRPWFSVGRQGIAMLNPSTHLHSYYPFPQEETAHVTALEIDQKGRVWCATDLGLMVWDNDTLQYFLDYGQKIPDAYTLYKHPSIPNSLLVGGEGRISRIVGGQLIAQDSLLLPEGHANGAETNAVHIILPNLGTGGYFLGIGQLLYHGQFDGKMVQCALQLDVASISPSFTIEKGLLARDGTIWLADDYRGIVHFSPQLGSYNYYGSNVAQRYTLVNSRLYDMACDEGGILWLGTHRGLMQIYAYGRVLVRHHRYAPGLRPNGEAFPMGLALDDAAGTLWLSMSDTTLYEFDLETGLIISIKDLQEEGPVGGYALNVVNYSPDSLLLGYNTLNGLWVYRKSTGTLTRYKTADGREFNNSIWNLFSLNTGRVLIHCRNKGAFVINTKRNLIEQDLTEAFKAHRYGAMAVQGRWAWNWHYTDGPYLYDLENRQKIDTVLLVSETGRALPEIGVVHNIVFSGDSVLLVGGRNGLFKFNAHFLPGNKCELQLKGHFSARNGLSGDHISAMALQNDTLLWVGTENGLTRVNLINWEMDVYREKDGLAGNELNFKSVEAGSHGQLFFGGVHGLTGILPKSKIPYEASSRPVSISHLNLPTANPDSLEEVYLLGEKGCVLRHNQNIFTIHFFLPNFAHPAANRYQYQLTGYDKDWLSAGNRTTAFYPNVPPGKYTFKVRAASSEGEWSPLSAITIEITRPYWQTWWFIGAMLLLGAGLVGMVSYIRNFRLRRANKSLELAVALRTREIAQKNRTLEGQRYAIEGKNVELQHLLSMLNRRNQDLTDSIVYAERIQAGVLPPRESLLQAFPNHFVLFKPRDIVSGDFYWFAQRGETRFFAVVDCTGHGVPGAFLSLIGYGLLNQIVLQEGEERPAAILEALDEKLKTTLRERGEGAKDGMDLVLVSVKGKQLSFAGAKRPMYMVRKPGELEVYKGTRRAIGDELLTAYDYPFEQQEFTLGQEPVTLYLHTDGFADQFNETSTRKYMVKRFKNFVANISTLPIEEQGQRIKDELKEWKGQQEQTDDILVAGIRLFEH